MCICYLNNFNKCGYFLGECCKLKSSQETFVSLLLTWFQMLPSFNFPEGIITAMWCWSFLRKKVNCKYNNVKKKRHGQFLDLASSTHLTSSTTQMFTEFSTFNCIYNTKQKKTKTFLCRLFNMSKKYKQQWLGFVVFT